MQDYKAEGIAGAKIGEQIVCTDCVEPQEWTEVTQDDLIMGNALEDDETVYSCVRCKKMISLDS